MSRIVCSECAALCCRYFALPIDNPETPRQYDDIRWYLCHDNVIVYILRKQWYLGILNACKHLGPDNRCQIYEMRPKVCRGYSMDNCDYHGGEYDFQKLFTSAEQLDRYVREQRQKAEKRKRSRRPTGRK